MSSDKIQPEAIIASRICHDMAGTVGAISNGLELAQMTGSISAETDEIQLVLQSLSSLTAQLKLFRMAFGASAAQQQVSIAELKDILSEYFFSYFACELDPDDLASRHEVKGVLLGIMCLVKNYPSNGQFILDRNKEQNSWLIAIGESDRAPLSYWDQLDKYPDLSGIEPSHCEFLLLSKHLETTNATAQFTSSPENTSLKITFSI